MLDESLYAINDVANSDVPIVDHGGGVLSPHAKKMSLNKNDVTQQFIDQVAIYYYYSDKAFDTISEFGVFVVCNSNLTSAHSHTLGLQVLLETQVWFSIELELVRL